MACPDRTPVSIRVMACPVCGRTSLDGGALPAEHHTLETYAYLGRSRVLCTGTARPVTYARQEG